MAKRLKKIGHPLRKKTRRKKIKASACDNSPEKMVAPAENGATQSPLPQAETHGGEAKFYTAKETAELLEVSAKQITAFLQKDRLPNAEKVSGKWRIPEMDIQALKKEIS